MGIVTIKTKERFQELGDIDGFLAYKGVKLRRNTYYIVCPYGIGDTLYIASLMKSYRRNHSEIQRLCLIVKKGHYQIPDWFDAVDEKIVSDIMVNDLNVFSVLTGTWKLKNYLYGHFRKSENWELLPEYQDCEIKNMVYRYKRLVLHLPPDCAMEEPKILPNPELQMGLMEEYQIGEKTIILMPYANSTCLMENGFWENLVGLFNRLGYQVVTNVKGDDEFPIKGTRGLCADIATMAALCEFCGLVITLRSGLSDVLAFTETKLVVINNREYHFNEWNLDAATNRKNLYSLLIGRDDIPRFILNILCE